ncbi:MAG: hypothetical protein R3F62_31680 [Planctomycetota bacterium]
MSRELTCAEAQPLHFDRSSEVELDPESGQALDRHLAACAACRAFVQETLLAEAAIASAVGEDPELNDPERAARTAARVVAAIEAQEPWRQAPARRAPGALPWLIAAVALLAAGVGIGRGTAPAPDGSLQVISGPDLQRQLDAARAENADLTRTLSAQRARIEALERALEEARRD